MAKDEFGTNKSNIAGKGDDYVETLVVNGKMVNVFINDYGQCYWFQWVDDNGELCSCSCGTYETDYKNCIENYFMTEIEMLRKTVRDLSTRVLDLERKICKENEVREIESEKQNGS